MLALTFFGLLLRPTYAKGGRDGGETERRGRIKTLNKNQSGRHGEVVKKTGGKKREGRRRMERREKCIKSEK